MKIDLLTLIDQGGCSAKLPADELNAALADLPVITNENLLVGIDTHDDGGVFKISEDYALIQTTDFFPPTCSDPFDFGQIAAANALSDIYAMGGQVLTALNLVMFPTEISLSVLKEILRGGQEKVKEAGGVILGGHTIADDIPKYGLSVTGHVHPNRIVTNSNAEPGDILILTKPIGTGIVITAKKNSLAPEAAYSKAIEYMKQLNNKGAEIMTKYEVKSATDITGFGLLGHAMKLADGSGVSIYLDSEAVPGIPGVMDLIELGCIPGAAFRNQDFCDAGTIFEEVDYNRKMLLFDAQTSGGLLMCVKPDHAHSALNELKATGYPSSAIIGEVTERKNFAVHVR